MNDYTKGILVGIGYSLAVIEKHCPLKELGPSNDAYDEIRSTADTVLIGSSINAMDATLCMLPDEIPKDMGKLPEGDVEEAQLKLLAGCAISFRDKVSLIKTEI